jgi:type VI secretion system secreted protein Hcp
MKRFALGILFLVVSILPFTKADAAAVECFLFISGIPGDSIDMQHKDQLDVLGWSIAEFQPGAGGQPAKAGMAAGRVQMQEFRFTARMSKASPILFRYGASGQPIQEAILMCRKTGMKQQDFLRIRFQELYVSNYQTGVLAPSAAPVPPPGIPPAAFVDGIPLDQVGMAFRAISIEYLSGGIGPPFVGGYDSRTNTVK